MNYLEVKVLFDFEDKTLAIDLIADIFYDFNLQGVITEDPDMAPEEGWGEDAADRPENHSVTGYFPVNGETEQKCHMVKEKLRLLYSQNNIKTKIVYNQINEEDWSESWKEFFWPEKISRNIVIKPTWREYHPGWNEIVLEIDPGMAFGTGTHPTTSMCVNMIENFINPGSSFLDIGTGSGILMLAAAKLGAEKLAGVDTDEMAVEIAGKNLLLNKIDPDSFNLYHGNLADTIEDRFDMVASNILSEIILILLKDVRRVLTEDGIFICSGITEGNSDVITNKLKSAGFHIIEHVQQENWVAFASKNIP